MNAILAFPIIYLVGFGSLAISNTFAIVFAFRFMQMLWLSGIADSAYQAMFNAVPPIAAIKSAPSLAASPSRQARSRWLRHHHFFVASIGACWFVSAAATTFIIWRASRAYNFALVDSLRKGRPTIFSNSIHPDTVAINAALDGMKNPDPIVRRISTEIISVHSNSPDALVLALSDEDTDVRISSLKGLTRLQASSALLDIASLLSALSLKSAPRQWTLFEH